MSSLLRGHAALCTATLLLACGTGTPPSKGDDAGAGGSTGGSSAGGGNAGNGSAGKVSGGSSGTGASVGGAGGTSGTGGTGGLGGSVGGGAGSGAAGGAGGGAGTSSMGGQGGSGAGTAGSGGTAGDAMSSGGMPMGGSAGDTAPSGGMGGGAGGSAYSGMVVLKDDFDAATTLDSKWFAYPDYDKTQQPKIDTTRVHSAPNALKVSSTSSGSFIMNPKGMALPTSNNKFYARVWINFEQATSMISGHAAYLVGAVAQDNSGTELRLGMSSPGSADMMDLNLQNPSDGGGGEVTRFSNGFTTGGNPGDFPGKGFTFDANKWYCLEALFDGGGSEFRVWVDAAEIMEMHVHDFSANSTARTMWGPSFNYIKIGGQNFSGTIGQVWYDDVFIGTEQVGCTL